MIYPERNELEREALPTLVRTSRRKHILGWDFPPSSFCPQSPSLFAVFKLLYPDIPRL
ncbi:hypothetical protein SLEP1_g16059 [Rubroshorea leprosula]|uniref:Uncharacterized protein n=1 Tax=Rubroshorea leprosula TaxID=152421 RepID=A0AAV5IV96_9ROSI|nr:hypothetical protein SLEP1_g16059 [Rubroshorea leprosula]